LKQKYSIEAPTCTGFESPKFSEASVEQFKTHCQNLDNYQIVALESAASFCKSTGISLALLDMAISIEHAMFCSRMEENFQIAEHGYVEGSHDVEEANLRMMLAASRCLISLKNL